MLPWLVQGKNYKEPDHEADPECFDPLPIQKPGLWAQKLGNSGELRLTLRAVWIWHPRNRFQLKFFLLFWDYSMNSPVWLLWVVWNHTKLFPQWKSVCLSANMCNSQELDYHLQSHHESYRRDWSMVQTVWAEKRNLVVCSRIPPMPTAWMLKAQPAILSTSPRVRRNATCNSNSSNLWTFSSGWVEIHPRLHLLFRLITLIIRDQRLVQMETPTR